MNSIGTSEPNVNMSPIQRDPQHRRGASRGETSSGEGTGPSRRIPSDQWEAKRALITQLYQEEKRSLKEVMDVLEKDHGFSATVKMFKSRIWKWGLDKKLKSDEVLAIMVLKRDRNAAQKESEFTIRGQPVDMDNINRYIKRNPQLVTRFNAGEVPGIQTTLEVQCRTPSPQLSPQVIGSPSRALRQPQSEALVLLREYLEDALDSGAWLIEFDMSCTTQAAEDHSEELFERMLTSLALINRCMSRGDVISLGAMLDPAFDALRELVATQSPVFATRMLALLWYLDTHNKNDLLQVVVDHVVSLVGVVLGEAHIMAQIWRRLAQDLSDGYYDFCDAAYVELAPLLEQRIGPANLITTMFYGDHVDFLCHTGRLDEALDLCNRYRANAEASGKQHPWLSELGTLRSFISSTQADTSGNGVGIKWEAQDDLSPMGDEHRAALHVQCGNQSMQAGHASIAIEQYQQALQILESTQGDERLVLASLANLETGYTKTGNVLEAERIRAVRAQRQDCLTAETIALAAQQRQTRPDKSRRGSSSVLPTTIPTTLATTAGEESGLLKVEGAGTWGGSPATSAGDLPWSWSPEVFTSPGSLTFPANDWRYPR